MNSTLLALLLLAAGDRPAASPSPVRIDYTIRVESAELSAVSVEMKIHDAPPALQVAMATHAEYDDQYWRYVTDLTGATLRGAVTVTRADSSVWQVDGPGGELTLRYRVHYPASPAMQQAAWKAHLGIDGGLIGGPHSFLYVVGAEHAAVRVTVALPSGWSVATGLTRGSAPGEFVAPDAEVLIDSPMLVGRLRRWQFAVGGVQHEVVYLGHPGGVSFDSTRLVANVERIARETVSFFRWMPYPAYHFLFEDGASGGLEHLNSVSIGVRSADVARDPDSPLAQIAHEFFHTWNEVHLRPASWIGLRHVMPAPTGELWWAEGVTLLYADLLMRRAGLHTPDSTRVAHLERLIAAYRANPSHGMVSLEHTSREFNLPPGGNGDYIPSMYTQGEVVGLMLDLMIRDGSGGRQSLDDVMRDLARRFTPARGYTGGDIEHATSSACRCDAHQFFDRYVRNAGAVDFDRGLAVLGLHASVTWEVARSASGAPAPDLRVSAYLLPGENEPRLQVWFPETAWAAAGLHTGDRIVSLNGEAMRDAGQLRSAIGRLQVGDTAYMEVTRASRAIHATVLVNAYQRPVVRIEEIAGATAAQRAQRARWEAGQ